MDYTQGDWDWRQNRGNNYYEHSVLARPTKIIAELSGEDCTINEVKANACLMAAAKNLQKALGDILNHCSNLGELREPAEAAMAKSIYKPID